MIDFTSRIAAAAILIAAVAGCSEDKPFTCEDLCQLSDDNGCPFRGLTLDACLMGCADQAETNDTAGCRTRERAYYDCLDPFYAESACARGSMCVVENMAIQMCIAEHCAAEPASPACGP